MKSEDDCFFWWQESYDKPTQCVEKQRHYSANKGPYSQGYGLPSGHVQLWELDHKEGRTPKNWCLWTVVLEKTPKIPWTARRLNQSILREINPEYSLEELMLKLKLQCFGHLMSTNNSLEKSLMLGKLEGRRRRECQRMRWLDGIMDAMNMNSDKLWDMVRAREAWCAAVHRVVKSQTRLSDFHFTILGAKNSKIIRKLKFLPRSEHKPKCCCCSVSQSCPILWDYMDCSRPGLPVPHHLLDFA